ncbi:aminotransferase class V-fold PLP-dependent enzyme [Marinilabilia rubra]|uniref:Aminotransferase class V n=1 Tax=Marinilabilia rubra TaxID=2162893 RepID=A0A2U2B4W5_9BACT|nr:aminotransferase class V-fold PLP-dependent enzyme [Marinilabilia rubra]PWD98110.1 aminotransferase class V [Marinilabilia rubra]
MPHFSNTYFDNGSTSWPKPPEVAEAMSDFLLNGGGTYGRAAYGRVYQTSMMVEECRNEIANLLGVRESANVVFTANATQGINSVLSGLELNDCEVLVSPLEHNAVMRPLEFLKQTRNVTWKFLPASEDGCIIPQKIPQVITPKTKLVIINHQSNVNGLVQPVGEVSGFIGDIPLMLDVTQSLGNTDVKGDLWGADFIAFTGHKGLLGPTGTGGFYVRRSDDLPPFWRGGTGSRSESFEMPLFAPDKYEAGTHNTVGISGLSAAIANKPESNWTKNHLNELITGLKKIKGVRILTADEPDQRGSLFSLVYESLKPSTIARRLYENYHIEIRAGLHCAPQAHRYLSTFPAGAVRIALSPYHSNEDLESLGMVFRDVLD